MDRTLNLSGLYKLLHNTLLITEEVKEILRRDCDEAAFVLKPWQMKTVVEKQTDESFCNCKKNEDEAEAEEIAAGIGRAIILAQELREKLKFNVASKKKVSRKETVENIYLANSPSTSDRRKVLKNNIITQNTNTNTAKSSDDKVSGVIKNDKVTSVVIKKSVGSTKQSNTVDKMPKVTSTKVVGKPKKRKNFILENKLNVKKISSANKPEIGNPNDISHNSRKSLPPEASIAELSDLIHKMTQSTENASICSPENIKNTCPLHGDNAFQPFQEQIIAIDIVEAFRHFNVPNDIVRVLRTYHTFLKTEADNLNDVKEDRYKKSVDTFLKEFEVMNIAMQDLLLEEPQLLNKVTKSITVFSSIFGEDLDSIQSNDVKMKTSTELEGFLKQYDIKNIVEPIIKNPLCNFSLAKGWTSNGIWNISCMKYFKNFSEAYNIRYCNKKQFLSLYETIQKLQRTKYLNILIQIILRDVIPTVKSNIEPATAEYAQAYKTMFILYQGLNPEVPVLVRTDS